jgi:hypothetical protein
MMQQAQNDTSQRIEQWLSNLAKVHEKSKPEEWKPQVSPLMGQGWHNPKEKRWAFGSSDTYWTGPLFVDEGVGFLVEKMNGRKTLAQLAELYAKKFKTSPGDARSQVEERVRLLARNLFVTI